MNDAAIGWAWQQACPSPSAKFVLVSLAALSDDRGLCSPGQTELLGMTCLSLSGLRRALRELQEVGLLAVVLAGGGDRSTLYRLPLSPRPPAARLSEVPRA